MQHIYKCVLAFGILAQLAFSSNILSTKEADKEEAIILACKDCR